MAHTRDLNDSLQDPAEVDSRRIALLMPADLQGSYQLTRAIPGIDMILAVVNNLSKESVPLPQNPKLFVIFCEPLGIDLARDAVTTARNATGLLIKAYRPQEQSTLGNGVIAFLILKILSLTSIIAAGVLIVRNHEEL